MGRMEKLSTTPRLFVEQPLAEGAHVELPAAASHYLVQVMRMKPGDPVRLFDDQTGEWLARMSDPDKRRAVVAIESQTLPRETVPDLWLCAAPLKKGRIDWLAEKACELGVARLIPVITQRTIVDRPKHDRLRAHMVEAAEQCGRTALPELAEPITLARLLKDWPAGRALIFADEEGGAPFAEVAAKSPAPAAILIGPEGGFTDAERALIATVPEARAVSLGPRILRADTAAAAAVSLWQAIAGDWR